VCVSVDVGIGIELELFALVRVDACSCVCIFSLARGTSEFGETEKAYFSSIWSRELPL